MSGIFQTSSKGDQDLAYLPQTGSSAQQVLERGAILVHLAMSLPPDFHFSGLPASLLLFLCLPVEMPDYVTGILTVPGCHVQVRAEHPRLRITVGSLVVCLASPYTSRQGSLFPERCRRAQCPGSDRVLPQVPQPCP